jgi:hypothetical protein
MGDAKAQPAWEPRCSLCGGELVRYRNIRIEPGAGSAGLYRLAWVCTRCSTAFPIAVGKGGAFRKPEPLFPDANAMEDR